VLAVPARCVPDEMVNRGLTRPIPDNTASTSTRLDAREAGRRGDLTQEVT
jgi:hypothetical protein